MAEDGRCCAFCCFALFFALLPFVGTRVLINFKPLRPDPIVIAEAAAGRRIGRHDQALRVQRTDKMQWIETDGNSSIEVRAELRNGNWRLRSSCLIPGTGVGIALSGHVANAHSVWSTEPGEGPVCEQTGQGPGSSVFEHILCHDDRMDEVTLVAVDGEWLYSVERGRVCCTLHRAHDPDNRRDCDFLVVREEVAQWMELSDATSLAVLTADKVVYWASTFSIQSLPLCDAGLSLARDRVCRKILAESSMEVKYVALGLAFGIASALVCLMRAARLFAKCRGFVFLLCGFADFISDVFLLLYLDHRFVHFYITLGAVLVQVTGALLVSACCCNPALIPLLLASHLQPAQDAKWLGLRSSARCIRILSVCNHLAFFSLEDMVQLSVELEIMQRQGFDLLGVIALSCSILGALKNLLCLWMKTRTPSEPDLGPEEPEAGSSEPDLGPEEEEHKAEHQKRQRQAPQDGAGVVDVIGTVLPTDPEVDLFHV